MEVVLIAFGLVALILFGIIAMFAWSDGCSASTAYYKDYDNTYWLPLNYVYEAGYQRREKNGKPLTAAQKNKARFGRAL